MRATTLALTVGIILLAVAPGVVHAFGRLEVYADPGLTQCTLSDNSPRITNIYVSETSYQCATGARFRIAESPGFTGVWMGETSPYTTVGNSRTDFSVAWGYGLNGQITLLTMTYQMFGTSACSTIAIAAPLGFQMPICGGCIFVELPCTGYVSLHVNCNGSFDCNPVPTESSTWGQVKALYRE